MVAAHVPGEEIYSLENPNWGECPNYRVFRAVMCDRLIIIRM